MRDAQAFNILVVFSSQPDDFFGFRECIILLISASVIGIIFILGKFKGNESFRIEIASPFYICCMLNFSVIVVRKLQKAFAMFTGSFNFHHSQVRFHCSTVYTFPVSFVVMFYVVIRFFCRSTVVLHRSFFHNFS